MIIKVKTHLKVKRVLGVKLKVLSKKENINNQIVWLMIINLKKRKKLKYNGKKIIKLVQKKNHKE